MQTTYTTGELARRVGIHVNTVRFYEQIGFLTPPERKPNGYRIYTPLQLAQCRVIRLAMRAQVLQNGLRKKAAQIVKLCAAQEFDAAIAESRIYSSMLSREIGNAEAAIASVESTLQHGAAASCRMLGRKAAAQALNVTPETLRTWERSGLIRIAKRENGYRVYTEADMDRLNIIRTLRCANYSLSAILRLTSGLDSHCAQSVQTLLNVPQPSEELVSVCDRLIVSLRSTADDAAQLTWLLREIKADFSPTV